MTAHERIDQSTGDGYQEPRESWVECSCGALIWVWQQFYNENPTDPTTAWAEHIEAMS